MDANKAIQRHLTDRLPYIRRVVQRVAKNDGVVDDIVQECCVRIIQKENLCRIEGKVNQWINTVVRNLTLDHLARKRWENDRLKSLEVEPVAPDKALSEQSISWVLQQFNSLTETQKNVMHLHYFRNMNTVEIGKELGVSQQAVSAHLSRALKTLRKRAKAQGLLGLLLPWNWDFSRWVKVGVMPGNQKIMVGIFFVVLLSTGFYIVPNLQAEISLYASPTTALAVNPNSRTQTLIPSQIEISQPIMVPSKSNKRNELNTATQAKNLWDADLEEKLNMILVDFNLKAKSFKEVLANLQEKFRLTIEFEPNIDLDVPVTLGIFGCTLGEALPYIVQKANLAFMLTDGKIYIGKADSKKILEARTSKIPKKNVDWDEISNSKFTGTLYQYWDRSERFIKGEIPYLEGKRHGQAKSYYPSGSLRTKFTSQKGISQGKYKSYFESGEIMGISEFKNGFLDGPRTSFYKTGQIKMKSKLIPSPDKKGPYLFTGPEIHFAEDGTLIKQIQHDGKGGSKVIYDKAKGIDLRQAR